MPIYSYECDNCGGEFDRFLSLENYKQPQKCVCGAEARKVITAAMVITDLPGYDCPVTGKWIEGRRAHEENLKRTGCRIYEPGETQQLVARKQADEAAIEESFAETACALVEAMPAKKREQLGPELSNGADVTVERL